MAPDTIGSKFDVLRRIGPRGLAKTIYYSRKVGAGPLGLVLHSQTQTDIAESASVNIDGWFFVGSISPGAARAVGPTRLSIASEATVRTGPGLPRIGHGSALRIEGEFRLGSTFINSEFRLLCEDRIEIGDGCAIAWDVTIADTDRHAFAISNEKSPTTAPVKIKDDVWIGYGASVKKGVTIGEGAVVASDSVVTDDVPPRTLVAGVPADIVDEDVMWSTDVNERY